MEFCFDFAAGWLGGCAGLFVGHPLDTVKVRLQTKGYSSTLKCFLDTYKHEKVRGFYNGMGFPLLTGGIVNCIFFGVYGSTLRLFGHSNWGKENYHPPLWHVAIAACAGGVAQLSILTPTELVKVQLQSKKYGMRYMGPFKCFISIYSANGLRGCYKGLFTQLLRDLPASAMYMVVYEIGLQIPRSSSNTQLPFMQMFVSGGIAGILSWSIIMPLDVVKSRIQADNPQHPRYRGMVHCFIDSYRSDGISIFGRGFLAVALRAFPTNAITLLTYSWFLDFCHKTLQK